MAKKAKKAKKKSPAKKKKSPQKKAAKAAPKKARVAKAAFRPPHKCRETMSGCLMFFPDDNGDYDLPAGGKPVDCSECKYWF
jgi:hypothetical protein